MTAHLPAAGLVKEATPAAPTATLVLAVDNMHCGGCLRSVERAALRIPGVSSARASLTAKRLTITYHPAQAGEVDLSPLSTRSASTRRRSKRPSRIAATPGRNICCAGWRWRASPP